MKKQTLSPTPDLSIVVPLFNEEANLRELHRRVAQAMHTLGRPYELILVDDGSRDATASILHEIVSLDPNVVAIHLSRNFGHQAALSAGLEHAQGRAVVLMDGDLQDPPEVLDQFVAAWDAGNDVVYAVRTKRKESLVKRVCYFAFYRLLRAVSDLDIPLDAGDFCLMDRKVVDVLLHLPERQRFLRGLRTFVGFQQVGIRYERAARLAGTPKYTWRALTRLAIDGLVQFSSFPLTLLHWFAAIIGVAAVGWTAWGGVELLRVGELPGGWLASWIILMVGTTQSIGVSILGEYVRRIFHETKGRPAFVVRDVKASDSCGRWPNEPEALATVDLDRAG